MTFRSLSWSLLLLPPVLTAGCSVAGLRIQRPQPDQTVSRWILVEMRGADLVNEGASAGGQLHAEATILAMAAVQDYSPKWDPIIKAADYFVEVLAIRPKGSVEVGQIVTISVRVGNAKPNSFYKLTASPTSIGTRIVGHQVQVVEGREEAQFRFTRVHDGFGIIGVDVEVLR